MTEVVALPPVIVREPPVTQYSADYVTYEVTAYTLRSRETGKTPDHPAYGVTASGERVQRHKTLACPQALPFGTRVYIPHFDHVYECQDRGGAITTGKLDIYMQDVDDALAFGRRELPVLILPPLSGEETVE